jgi:hypothetical protein
VIYKLRYCFGHVALFLVCNVFPDTWRIWWWLLPHAGLVVHFDWNGQPNAGPKGEKP